MCLVNFQWQKNEQFPFVLAANRDEAYDRPTAPAEFWESEPMILAGQDLLKKGTWLGITKTGRFAALTNYRDLTQIKKEDLKSRGELVANFLRGSLDPLIYLKQVQTKAHRFEGFNLLVGTMNELYYFNNIEEQIKKLKPGTYGLSNRFLNTPWPKVVKGKQRLKTYMQNRKQIDPDELFTILQDEEQAEKDQLPNTGLPKDLEKQLSSIFIKTPNYGTRSSTVLFIDRKHKATFLERTYEKGTYTHQKQYSFHIKKP